ncbi:response regulator transcription factor [Paenibacillus sp. 1001270B_150601_E10]|uniref:response regulator transcription factor n=1 Tax=Paenibacillus sp. 1001270B_150601_E10 TaxID=2787079 RepID=UPI00189FE67E|nr:response regulator transcription factor [Paenibacillus sp. 1001270B_150601_E10]
MEQRITILIVDDEALMRELIADYLVDEGYNILQAENGTEALRIMKETSIDLVILDIMMPGMNGYEVCSRLREFSDALVIMLTAKSEEEDKLAGYKCGVDDYITKPFSPKVLAAKVGALAERFCLLDIKPEEEEPESFDLDEQARELRIQGKVILLSSKEFEMLSHFMRHPNQVLTRDSLLNSIWGFDYFGDARAVDTSIKRLRRKLGVEARRIVTVRGNGYKYQP